MFSEHLENQLAILLRRAVEEQDRAELEKILEQVNRLLKARETERPRPSE
jgi:hypothetical protein